MRCVTPRVVLAAVLLLAVPRLARADEPAPPPPPAPAPAPPPSTAEPSSEGATEADPVLWRRLFIEGRVAAARHDYAAACANFEASLKLEPNAVGTVLNLALCNENLGRFATALRHYRTVVERSRPSRPDRAEVAEAKVREIEPRVSALRVTVSDVVAQTPGLAVSIDGVKIDASQWGKDQPIDGGNHVIEVSAPTKRTVKLEVPVDVERARAVVAIPALVDAPSTTLGWVIGSAGAAALVAGASFGVAVAVQCGGFFHDTCKGAKNESDLGPIKTEAWIADIGVGLGVIGLGIGGYMLLTADSGTSTRRTEPAERRESAVQVVPFASTRGGGGVLRGTF